MSLIACPECGREVSDKAAACPDCAYPLNQDRAANSETVKAGTQRATASYEIGYAVQVAEAHGLVFGILGFFLALLVGYGTGSFAVGVVLAVAALVGGISMQYRG